MADEYGRFIEAKGFKSPTRGCTPRDRINEMLFDFQHDIVEWALKKGRAAVFADCGLGKTPMQLEWARQIPGRGA